MRGGEEEVQVIDGVFRRESSTIHIICRRFVYASRYRFFVETGVVRVFSYPGLRKNTKQARFGRTGSRNIVVIQQREEFSAETNCGSIDS